MPQVSQIAVDDLALTLYTERGEVAGASKWSTMEISGGGGSGYVHQGTGYSSTAPVRSRTTEHDQFFVRTAAGKEIPVRVQNVNVALRDGQDLSVFWAVGAGRESGPFLAFHNHTTDETTWMTKSGGKELFGSGLTIRLVLTFLALAVSVILLLVAVVSVSVIGMAILAVLSWFSWDSLRKILRKLKKLEAEIKNAVMRSLGGATA
jgi:hypothetical protein